MEILRQIGEDAGFLALFIVGVVIVYTFAGQDVTYWLLILILAGQVVFNYDAISDFIQGLMPSTTPVPPSRPNYLEDIYSNPRIPRPTH